MKLGNERMFISIKIIPESEAKISIMIHLMFGTWFEMTSLQ